MKSENSPQWQNRAVDHWPGSPEPGDHAEGDSGSGRGVVDPWPGSSEPGDHAEGDPGSGWPVEQKRFEEFFGQEDRLSDQNVSDRRLCGSSTFWSDFKQLSVKTNWQSKHIGQGNSSPGIFVVPRGYKCLLKGLIEI